MPVVYNNRYATYRFSVIIRQTGKEGAEVYQGFAYPRNRDASQYTGGCHKDILSAYMDIIDIVIAMEYAHKDFENIHPKYDFSQILNWLRYDNKWTFRT